MMCSSGNCYYCEKPNNMIKTFEIKSEFEQGSILHNSFPLGIKWKGDVSIKTKSIHDIIEYVRKHYPRYEGPWWEIYRAIEDEGIFTIENETIKLTEI